MKIKHTLIGFFALSALTLISFKAEEKLINKNGHIHFYSHTSFEDITADNYKAVSTLDTESGDVVYSIPMQGFEFEKELMQKHFNSKNFLNTSKFPKAKFKGSITDLSKVDFNTNGTYEVTVSGQMTIKDITKDVTETGTIVVSADGIETKSRMDLTLADYGISFKKGTPSTNIAKTIEVTAHVKYSK